MACRGLGGWSPLGHPNLQGCTRRARGEDLHSSAGCWKEERGEAQQGGDERRSEYRASTSVKKICLSCRRTESPGQTPKVKEGWAEKRGRNVVDAYGEN